ncbi:MAG: alkaline phytoceramidase [Thiobacillus sp.]|nr:alkaline phytoceramidase [Thiobacillus sp.]
MKTDQRALGLWLLAAALAVVAVLLPPLAQPPAYHDFADQRACRGLPNCFDTASNALFVLAGAIGLLLIRRAGRVVFRERREAMPYRLFFLGAVLIGFGSGYYHLDPANERLLWDRLAMMLGFMAWFAAIVGERVSPRAGLRLLPLFLAAGLGSVAWWGWSEMRGIGDLRFYLLVQLIPVLLVPLLLRLYPPRYSGDRAILAVIGLYLLALLFDLGDRPVFGLTGGWLSGHTLKHVLAAAAVGVVALHLRRRRAE